MSPRGPINPWDGSRTRTGVHYINFFKTKGQCGPTFTNLYPKWLSRNWPRVGNTLGPWEGVFTLPGGGKEGGEFWGPENGGPFRGLGGKFQPLLLNPFHPGVWCGTQFPTPGGAMCPPFLNRGDTGKVGLHFKGEKSGVPKFSGKGKHH